MGAKNGPVGWNGHWIWEWFFFTKIANWITWWILRCDPAYYVVTSKPICRGKTLACYTDVKKQLGKHNIVNNTLNGVKSQCLAACEMTFYTDQLITTAQYPNEATYMYTEDSCIIARKLLKRACKVTLCLSKSKFYKEI